MDSSFHIFPRWYFWKYSKIYITRLSCLRRVNMPTVFNLFDYKHSFFVLYKLFGDFPEIQYQLWIFFLNIFHFLPKELGKLLNIKKHYSINSNKYIEMPKIEWALIVGFSMNSNKSKTIIRAFHSLVEYWTCSTSRCVKKISVLILYLTHQHSEEVVIQL